MNYILKQEIEKRLKQRSMTIAELERRAGLKASAIRNIFSGRSLHPRANTISAMAKALECEPDELFKSDERRQHNSSNKLMTGNFDLFMTSTQVVLDTLKSRKAEPSINKVITLIRATYSFGLAKGKNVIDKEVVEWIMDERLS